MIYGEGEPIFFEIKLLGQSAEHLFFLETILPAIEAAGQTRDPRWKQGVNLWGHFDIDAVYVAYRQKRPACCPQRLAGSRHRCADV